MPWKKCNKWWNHAKCKGWKNGRTKAECHQMKGLSESMFFQPPWNSYGNCYWDSDAFCIVSFVSRSRGAGRETRWGGGGTVAWGRGGGGRWSSGRSGRPGARSEGRGGCGRAAGGVLTQNSCVGDNRDAFWLKTVMGSVLVMRVEQFCTHRPFRNRPYSGRWVFDCCLMVSRSDVQLFIVFDTLLIVFG